MSSHVHIIPKTKKEMIEELKKTRQSPNYKVITSAGQETISSAVSIMRDQMVDALIAQSRPDFDPKGFLNNTVAVQGNALEYLQCCEEMSVMPSIQGLAMKMGMGRENITYFRNKYPNHATTQFINMFEDMCAEIISMAAERNAINPVFAIFKEKAKYNWVDKQELNVIAQQAQQAALGETKTPEQIAEQYGYLPEIAESEDNK